MMRFGLAAVLALALAACGNIPGMGGSSGPAIPPTPQGAQAPVELPPVGPRADQATLNDDERRQLEELVASYLGEVQNQFGQGMAPAEGFVDVVAPMQPETDHRWHVDLVGGVTYRFIGACDNECSNLDFELIAPQGGVVASDLLADDYPVAEFTPSENGRYIGRLLMRACSIAPCYAGARVLTPAAAAAETK